MQFEKIRVITDNGIDTVLRITKGNWVSGAKQPATPVFFKLRACTTDV